MVGHPVEREHPAILGFPRGLRSYGSEDRAPQHDLPTAYVCTRASVVSERYANSPLSAAIPPCQQSSWGASAPASQLHVPR
jgi:hypothetical protein